LRFGVLLGGQNSIYNEVKVPRRLEEQMPFITDSSESLHAGIEAAVPASAPLALPLRRWSVEQYHAIVQAGIIDEDDNVEVLEGWIVKK
jgi:hypothetical protein